MSELLSQFDVVRCELDLMLSAWGATWCVVVDPFREIRLAYFFLVVCHPVVGVHSFWLSYVWYDGGLPSEGCRGLWQGPCDPLLFVRRVVLA